LGDQVEKNAVGRACDTHGSRGEVHMGFWWGNVRERGHLEVLGIDESIILKWASKKLDRGYGQERSD
jgi:hypothetical protein